MHGLMLLCALGGAAAFHGGRSPLSSRSRARACVATLPSEPQKTAEGIDVKQASLQVSKLLKEQATATKVEKTRCFGRCEPWAPEKATLLDVINVVGRFRDSKAWAERTEVAVLEDARVDSKDQAATATRRDYANRMGQAERLAFMTNVPGLPFTDDKMAAAVGKTVDDFASAPVEAAHLAVVFDALAHSKTTLVSRADADARIKSWRAADGSLDADAFEAGLRKGTVAVLAANFVLYFLSSCGIAIVGKIVLGGLPV